jgi:uncharacterized RDD family membrane protein YckC
VWLTARVEGDHRYCSTCGAPLLAGAVFCTSCGRAVGAALESPVQATAGGFAGYGRRVAAAVIDSIIVYGVAIIVVAIIIAIYFPDATDSESGQTGLGLIFVPIVPLYSAFLQGLWHGQTVGKRCLGIAVRDLDGTEIQLAQSFGRSYARAATWLFFPVWVLDSLWPLWEGKRRALHDLVAGTVVVVRQDDDVDV